MPNPGRVMSKRTKMYFAPEETIVFSAFLSNDIGAIRVNQNIVFDHVYVNDFNGYHSTQGLFIVPVSGIYFFTFSLLHGYQDNPVKPVLFKNGVIVAQAHSELRQYEQSSQSVILKVEAGDEIYVRNIEYSNVKYLDQLLCSFSGFILWQKQA